MASNNHSTTTATTATGTSTSTSTASALGALAAAASTVEAAASNPHKSTPASIAIAKPIAPMPQPIAPRTSTSSTNTNTSTTTGATRLKPKQKRYRANAEQLRELVALFNVNPSPTAAELTALSIRIQMPTQSVILWFKNRRARVPHKREEKARRAAALKAEREQREQRECAKAHADGTLAAQVMADMAMQRPRLVPRDLATLCSAARQTEALDAAARTLRKANPSLHPPLPPPLPSTTTTITTTIPLPPQLPPVRLSIPYQRCQPIAPYPISRGGIARTQLLPTPQPPQPPQPPKIPVITLKIESSQGTAGNQVPLVVPVQVQAQTPSTPRRPRSIPQTPRIRAQIAYKPRDEIEVLEITQGCRVWNPATIIGKLDDPKELRLGASVASELMDNKVNVMNKEKPSTRSRTHLPSEPESGLSPRTVQSPAPTPTPPLAKARYLVKYKHNGKEDEIIASQVRPAPPECEEWTPNVGEEVECQTDGKWKLGTAVSYSARKGWLVEFEFDGNAGNDEDKEQNGWFRTESMRIYQIWQGGSTSQWTRNKLASMALSTPTATPTPTPTPPPLFSKRKRSESDENIAPPRRSTRKRTRTNLELVKA